VGNDSNHGGSYLLKVETHTPRNPSGNSNLSPRINRKVAHPPPTLAETGFQRFLMQHHQKGGLEHVAVTSQYRICT
jgi:hypothetical protein